MLSLKLGQEITLIGGRGKYGHLRHGCCGHNGILNGVLLRHELGRGRRSWTPSRMGSPGWTPTQRPSPRRSRRSTRRWRASAPPSSLSTMAPGAAAAVAATRRTRTRRTTSCEGDLWRRWVNTFIFLQATLKASGRFAISVCSKAEKGFVVAISQLPRCSG